VAGEQTVSAVQTVPIEQPSAARRVDGVRQLDGVREGDRTAPAGRRRSRRDEILQIAVDLFAKRGYHGVSMDDIGAAAGVTGPALYHHFAGKEAMLVAALTPVSQSLLTGGRDRVRAHRDDPAAALAALVGFHVDFALAHPAVIALHLHELDRLPNEPRRQIRRLQRQYVEEWVQVLRGLRTDLTAAEARVLAHAAFGLMNSTPFQGDEVPQDRRAALLGTATLVSLQPPGDRPDPM
jgi:AcrR family transcriptional regulator